MATAYHAVVVEANVRPGMTVCIIGIGGLGMSGLVFAVLLGADVYAVDVVPTKLKEAVRLGAHECFENLDEARVVDFDVIIDFAGTGQTTSMAVEKTRKGGKVVVVGLAASSITVSVTALVTRSISIIGSFGASQDDLRAVFKLLADGKVPLELCEIDFADVPAGLDALNDGCGHTSRPKVEAAKRRVNSLGLSLGGQAVNDTGDLTFVIDETRWSARFTARAAERMEATAAATADEDAESPRQTAFGSGDPRVTEWGADPLTTAAAKAAALITPAPGPAAIDKLM
ncbi:putative alcohol dehydrogenase [Colletotrichum asianum]|uniref:Putative alcohol dehydrogenase n=1 Tax=Colletotrichum asianum TaxID=702518 RepID=A0A8H3ZHJ1_9PEZI|nr:putative alcohol dehydrogenase [Colletotrichum asianum]